MTPLDRPLILCTASGVSVLVVAPHACNRCGHVTMIYRSVGGRTFCWMCVPQQEAA